jgi:hypothetical protein
MKNVKYIWITTTAYVAWQSILDCQTKFSKFTIIWFGGFIICILMKKSNEMINFIENKMECMFKVLSSKYL